MLESSLHNDDFTTRDLSLGMKKYCPDESRASSYSTKVLKTFNIINDIRDRDTVNYCSRLKIYET